MDAASSQPSIARWRLLLCGIAMALLCCFGAGCGTVVNLAANPQDGSSFNQSMCYPMGGVTRALINGGVWTATGPTFVFAEGEIGENLLLAGEYTAGGIGELVIDVPLSLVGDVLTLPFAYANYQGKSYSTKLLEAERRGPATPEPSKLAHQQAASGDAQIQMESGITTDKLPAERPKNGS